ncbi:MAG: hypothetical protein LUC60_04505 [Lachnospiraceae bacterium]|nr:hypothetical protein [Lachnospiraceae bacterium]
MNEELLAQIGVYFIPYQSRLVFRGSMNLFLLLFLILMCMLKIFPAAFMLIIDIFLLKAQRDARKRCEEATLRQLKELSGKAEIRYSSQFNTRDIVAENHMTGIASSIPYEDIVEIVARPDIYLLVSRKGELVFVFRSGLENARKFIDDLFSRNTRIGILKKIRFKLTGKVFHYY